MDHKLVRERPIRIAPPKVKVVSLSRNYACARCGKCAYPETRFHEYDDASNQQSYYMVLVCSDLFCQPVRCEFDDNGNRIPKLY